MYNKTSFINETDYAEVSGTRWIMRDLPNYAEGHQLCAKLCAHNRIIQRSLLLTVPNDLCIEYDNKHCLHSLMIFFKSVFLN